MTTTSLPILHFNDVYRVRQKYNNSDSYISAAQFAQLLQSSRAAWKDRTDGEKDGLVLFSGDVFNPSIESTITRGSHMVPLLNTLSLSCSCLGNHDLDFSFPHFSKLVADCNFPWLMSNIVDETGEVPAPLKEFVVLERCGVRIGVIALVESDWIQTIPSFPANFKHLPMKDVGIRLSKLLRDPDGEHRVDFIIALTHSRVNNDIDLANDLEAVAGLGEDAGHGADLLLGGHDHMYYIGRGAERDWEGWCPPKSSMHGTERDRKTMLVKSGTDFRDLSELTLELASNPPGSIRRKVIKSIKGKHHSITPESPTSTSVQSLIDRLLSTVTKTLDKPACFTLTTWDVRSELARTEETAFANWLSDVLMHAYSDSLDAKGGGKADIVFNCAGTLRGDSQYGPGLVTLGDILEILPFEDPVVVILMDGEAIWAAMESALSSYPAQEGRFPVCGGMRVVWDSRLPPRQRVKSIDLVLPRSDTDGADNAKFRVVKGQGEAKVYIREETGRRTEPIERKKGGRMYKVVTREYMALGYDGYEAMKGSKFIVDDENGSLMSSIVRSFLLGATFITRKKQILASLATPPSSPSKTQNSPSTPSHPASQSASSTLSNASSYLNHKTQSSILKAQLRSQQQSSGSVVDHSNDSIRDAMRIARNEHLSECDDFDGASLRKHVCRGPTCSYGHSPSQLSESRGKEIKVDQDQRDVFSDLDETVAVVAPMIDGRLLDLGRSGTDSQGGRDKA